MKKDEKPIVFNQAFNVSIEQMWETITKVNKMRRWLFSEIQSFEPKVGFETQFEVKVENNTFVHVWKVLEVLPMKKIAYYWKYEEYPGLALAEFNLSEKNNKVNLNFVFTTLEDFPDSIPEFKRESCIQGWNYFLNESLNNFIKENHLSNP